MSSPPLDYDAWKRSRKPVAPAAPAGPVLDYESFKAQKAATAPAERPGLMTRTMQAGRELVGAVRTDPIGVARQVGKGLLQNVTDAAALSTPTGMIRIGAEEAAAGRGLRGVGSRVVGAAALAATPMLGRVGLAADAAINAGVGAAQTPDDPGVGAMIGGALPVVGRAGMRGAAGVASVARRVGRPMADLDLTGVTAGLAESAQPHAPSVVTPKRPPSEDQAVRMVEAFPKQLGDKEMSRLAPRGVRRLQAPGVPSAASPEVVDNMGHRVVRRDDVQAFRNAEPYFSGDTELRNRPAVPPSVDMAGQPVPRRIGLRTPAREAAIAAETGNARFAPEAVERDRINAQIDQGELAPFTMPDKYDEMRRTPAQQAALKQYESATYRELTGDAAAQLRRDADELVVKPNQPVAPASTGAFPEGYQTPDLPDDPVVSAVPDSRPDAPANLFGKRPVDRAVQKAEIAAQQATNAVEGHLAPEKALAALEDPVTAQQWRSELEVLKQKEAAARGEAEQLRATNATKQREQAARPAAGVPTHFDKESASAIVDGKLKDWKAVGLATKERDRRFGVLTAFEKKLEAVGGNVSKALEGFDKPADIKLVKEAFGLTAPAKVRVDAPKPGEPLIVPGNPKGTTPLELGKKKSVDYRAYTLQQMEAEVRRAQGVLERETMHAPLGATSRIFGTNETSGGMTRSGAYSIGRANQAKRILDAADRELRKRYVGLGMSPEEIDARVMRASYEDLTEVPLFEPHADDTFQSPDFDDPDSLQPGVGYADSSSGVAAAVDDGGSMHAPAPVSRETEQVAVRESKQGVLREGAVDAGPAGADKPVQRARDGGERPGSAASGGDGEAAAGSAAARRELPEAPRMEPADEVEINWRTWGEPGNEGERTTLARVKARAQALESELETAKGYRSFADQKADAEKSLKAEFDTPLDLDSKKLKNLSGAEIVAVKEIIQSNERTLEALARDVTAGNLTGDDLAQALKVMDQLNASTDEALMTVVSESARAGRTLGYLRNSAMQSQDPAVWLLKAQRVYGDRPLPATTSAQIRALAKEIADTCG